MVQEKYKAFGKAKISDGLLSNLIARLLSATASVNSISFPYEINTIWMKNIGAKRIYYRFDNDASVSASDQPYLEPNEAIRFDGLTNKLTYICDTGESSTLRIKAY